MNLMRSRRPRCADQCMGEKPCSNLSSHPFRSFWEKYHVEHQAGKAMCSKDQILPSPNWIRQCLSTGLWRQAFISHMHQHLSVEGIYMKYLFVLVHCYVLTHFDILRMWWLKSSERGLNELVREARQGWWRSHDFDLLTASGKLDIVLMRSYEDQQEISQDHIDIKEAVVQILFTPLHVSFQVLSDLSGQVGLAAWAKLTSSQPTCLVSIWVRQVMLKSNLCWTSWRKCWFAFANLMGTS